MFQVIYGLWPRASVGFEPYKERMQRACIVVTTDFSADSLLALEPAATLARLLDADLAVLHVVPDLRAIPHGSPLAPPQSDPELSRMEREAREHMTELQGRLPEGLTVDFVVLCAEQVGEAINDYAADRDAAMVVIASHGRTGVRGVLLGSVAEATLRRAVVPVLVIPADPDKARLKLPEPRSRGVS